MTSGNKVNATNVTQMTAMAKRKSFQNHKFQTVSSSQVAMTPGSVSNMFFKKNQIDTTPDEPLQMVKSVSHGSKVRFTSEKEPVKAQEEQQ